MPSIKTIRVDSSDDPRIRKFRLRRDSELKPYNELIADSEKVVLRLIDSGVTLKKLLALPSHYRKHGDTLYHVKDCEFFEAPRQIMESVVGHRIHQGMMGLARRPDDAHLSHLGRRIIAVNRVMDPQNIGSIVRAGVAFGIDSIIADCYSCSPFIRRAVRVSMGSVFQAKVIHTQDLLSMLMLLQRHGYKVLAAANLPYAKNIDSVISPTKSVLVIGNEDQGVEREVIDISDEIVRIPIHQKIDSLNAGCAASILCYALSHHHPAGASQRDP